MAKVAKSFIGENTVFLLLTALIRNFYKFIMARLDVKRFGLKAQAANTKGFARKHQRFYPQTSIGFTLTP